MGRVIDVDHWLGESRSYRETGGVSENNRSLGFLPAFLDTATDVVYLSRNGDGSPAACHFMDGLPDGLVGERDAEGHALSVKDTVVAGFERGGRFFTREQAALLLADDD